ncbi:MAG TPA: SDR family NAD(P)-dependent oxidoreductase, partial [Novosphingobium sp.]
MSATSFDGQCVVITGAGGGLGRAYALEIARRGGAVVVNDLGGDVDGHNPGPEMAEAVVAEITAAGGKAIANFATVNTREGGEAIAEAALSAFGRIDGLINNAGILRNAWLQDLAEEDRDALIATHLLGAFNVTRAVWPTMVRQSYGRVLFTASASGMFGNPMQSAYGAAKAATVGLMNVLAQEGAGHGILCNALLPTAQSRMGIKMDPSEFEPVIRNTAPYASSLTPEFVAPTVVYLVSRACTTTHDSYSVLGGRIARVF